MNSQKVMLSNWARLWVMKKLSTRVCTAQGSTRLMALQIMTETEAITINFAYLPT